MSIWYHFFRSGMLYQEKSGKPVPDLVLPRGLIMTKKIRFFPAVGQTRPILVATKLWTMKSVFTHGGEQ
jgi:hypothetical protein